MIYSISHRQSRSISLIPSVKFFFLSIKQLRPVRRTTVLHESNVSFRFYAFLKQIYLM
jgi:hypothetical protein